MGEAWSVLSTVMSGICVFGAIGFGLDYAFGTRPILVAAGLLAGTALGLYLVYAKYVAADETPLPAVPAVAGWSRKTVVSGAAGEPHPPTPELANWPDIKRRPERPHAS